MKRIISAGLVALFPALVWADLRPPSGIANSSTQQTATINITSGTIGNLTIGTMTVVGNQGYVLLYSSTVFVGVSSCTTSATFVPTNTAITLTPKRTTSRIEISATGSLNTATGASASTYATIFRGATNLASNSSAGTFFCTLDLNLASAEYSHCAMGPIFDLPATTSATTYTVYINNDSAGTSVCWNKGVVGTATAIMTVEEWGY